MVLWSPTKRKCLPARLGLTGDPPLVPPCPPACGALPVDCSEATFSALFISQKSPKFSSDAFGAG